MNITLQGTNLELNDTLRSYVDEKMRDVFRAFGDMNLDPIEAAVELEVSTPRRRGGERHFRAEANLSVPGRLLRAEASADDMYKAITQMKRILIREIREWRARHADASRQGARQATDMTDEEQPGAVHEEAGERWNDEAHQDDTPGRRT